MSDTRRQTNTCSHTHKHTHAHAWNWLWREERETPGISAVVVRLASSLPVSRLLHLRYRAFHCRIVLGLDETKRPRRAWKKQNNPASDKQPAFSPLWLSSFLFSPLTGCLRLEPESASTDVRSLSGQKNTLFRGNCEGESWSTATRLPPWHCT